MKKIGILSAVAVLAAVAILYEVRASRAVAEVYVAQRGTAVSAVYGTVKVLATMTIDARTRDSGILHLSDRLATNLVVGLDVTNGEVLATINNQDLIREIAKAGTDLRAAEARQRLGPPSQPQFNTQEALLARLEKLAQMQSVAATDLERTRNDVQTLRERVGAEQLELDRVVTILREQAGVLQDRKARGVVTSPLDGYLSAINCGNDAFIGDGAAPFTVATRSTYLEGKINEEDVGLVAPKMKAAVRLYSYANQDFVAAVDQVLPTANDQHYTIILSLDTPPSNLMTGMTGEMNIITGKRENALLIPSRAVLADHVLVVQDNVVKPRAVKIGFRNLERAEILEGLKEGEQVVVADQDLFKPGQRVRAITINM